MHTDPTPEKQYPITTIAEALGVHPKTVQNLIASGQLQATNIATGEGRATYRVSESALAAFLEARRVAPS